MQFSGAIKKVASLSAFIQNAQVAETLPDTKRKSGWKNPQTKRKSGGKTPQSISTHLDEVFITQFTKTYCVGLFPYMA